MLPVIIYLGYPMPMYWWISCSLHLLIDAVFVLYPVLSVNGMRKELSTDPEFKASLGWYNDWKRRHSISMRTKTTLAQRLPANMEDKIVTFHQFVVRARRRCEYPLSHIINMDETPMRFELPATRTLEFTGNRTVPITTCGADKQVFISSLVYFLSFCDVSNYWARALEHVSYLCKFDFARRGVCLHLIAVW